MAQTLKNHYEKVVVTNFVKSKKYSNVMEIPKLLSVTINMGVGEALADKNVIEKAMSDLEKISGQKPVACKAKKSIAGFKVREGVPIGCKVVLRRKRMYDFVERLITVALPRVRDFRGLNPRSFDGRGNFTLGLREQIVFPEIDYDKIDALRGMDITIVTSAKTNSDALQFLIEMGFPFKE